MGKRQRLNDQYHGQEPPDAWEEIHAEAEERTDLSDPSEPTAILFHFPSVEGTGQANARLRGWAV